TMTTASSSLAIVGSIGAIVQVQGIVGPPSACAKASADRRRLGEGWSGGPIRLSASAREARYGETSPKHREGGKPDPTADESRLRADVRRKAAEGGPSTGECRSIP